MDEFTLIETFFKTETLPRPDVLLGIGDDAAAIGIPPDKCLLVSTDTLVSGVHFLPEWDAYDIACKAVLTNVSDMVAMAAEPCWLTLALTLPALDKKWLGRFAKGLFDSLHAWNIALIGGDTTQGPLAISMTILGVAEPQSVVKRSGAKPGDVIFVSDPLGAAALAIHVLEKQAVAANDRAVMMQALLHPNPRGDLIPFLRQYASAAIDISDGLSTDLNHICEASAVGACLFEADIPLHPLLQKYAPKEALSLALSGGDDYALCFTVPALKQESLMKALKTAGLVCYPVGFIEENLSVFIENKDKQRRPLQARGYSHF